MGIMTFELDLSEKEEIEIVIVGLQSILKKVKDQDKYEVIVEEMEMEEEKTAEEIFSRNILPEEDIDSKGEKYNPEIHSPTRVKNLDGSWKKIRRSKTQPTTIVSQEEVTEISIPIALPPSPPASSETFNSLMAKITKALNEKKLTRAQFQEVLISLGIESPPILATRLDLIPTVGIIIDSMIG